ncbi:MAG: TolC family protein [Deltaproteobacteria bacterium]|nr:TolC family protein [Deltaproteobacteria bacterium]
MTIRARAEAQQVSSPLPALPTDPVLAKLVEQSLAARPELAQAEALVRADRERVSQEGAFPDPMLQIGIQNDSFTSIQIGEMETSFYSIMASQSFPWPGKRGLRSEVAELVARQGETNVARLRLTAEADVRRTYLDLLLARDRLALLDRLDAIWSKSEAVARVRYESGEGAQSDVLRSQLEVNRLKQRRWALQAQERALVQGLNRLRGHRLDEPIATTAHLADLGTPTNPDAQAALDNALARSPELAAARLGVIQSEKSQALARKSYFGDLVLSAGVMPRGGLPPMWQLNLGSTVPIFAGSKQSRAVAESEARAAAEQRNADATGQILGLRIEERRTVLAALLDTITLYREGLLIQSEATADSTLAQYSVGKVSFASVLEANAGFVADEDGFLQAIADAQRLAIAFHEVSLEPTATALVGAMGAPGMPGATGRGMGEGPTRSTGAGGAPPVQAAEGGMRSTSGM